MRSPRAFLFSPYTKLYHHLVCKDKKRTNLIAPCTVQVTYEAPVVIDHAIQNPELGHVWLQHRVLLCSDSAFVRAILEDMRAMQQRHSGTRTFLPVQCPFPPQLCVKTTR